MTSTSSLWSTPMVSLSLNLCLPSAAAVASGWTNRRVGFLYTQSSDRLWRKNRQTTSGSSCYGHDINRNWPYQWSVNGGASTDPCADDFKGLAASDAPETTALAAYLKTLKANQGLKLFIDYHSYSQLFMTRMSPLISLLLLIRWSS
jgi:Zinc carboxypeptidase